MTEATILALEAGSKFNGLVATEVVGWTRNEKGFWFKPGKRHSWRWDAIDPPPYSTDPSADYEVLVLVRENWGAEVGTFSAILSRLWFDRGDYPSDSPTQYQPGDYSRAALLSTLEAKVGGAAAS